MSTISNDSPETTARFAGALWLVVILVVLGASAYERGQAEKGKELFAPFAGRVELSYTNGLSLEQVEERVSKLGDDALVLFGSFLQDAAGRDYDNTAPLTRISRASHRPVFGVIYEDLGAGILGGELVSMQHVGKVAADLALRVLGGERASAIPLADVGLTPMFDARELERWGLPDRMLPPASIVLHRTRGLFEQHGKAIGDELRRLPGQVGIPEPATPGTHPRRTRIEGAAGVGPFRRGQRQLARV